MTKIYPSYLIVSIIHCRKRALMALGPGLNGKVGFGDSSTSYTLCCTCLCVLQDHGVQVARGNWGTERDGEQGGGEGRYREAEVAGNISCHIRAVEKYLQ